jgi:hypothetical protein
MSLLDDLKRLETESQARQRELELARREAKQASKAKRKSGILHRLRKYILKGESPVRA